MRILPNIPRSTHEPENIDLSLTTLLGRGRHGSVFLGQLDNHRVAVKIPATNDRHSAEHHALGRFDHPNIVSLIREPLPNGALVLEHLGGGSLADLLSTRAQVSVGETADLIRPICDALRHIHEHGWIHGDIAPSNIAFREDRTPVLIDFATARPADRGELSEGNPDFVGPLREAATAVDVRSLAATALRALGTENRWEPDPTRVRSTLAALIERADTGQPVSVDELDDIFAFATRGSERESPSGSTAQPTVDPVTPHRLGIGSTRSFGPRPSSGGLSETRRTCPASAHRGVRSDRCRSPHRIRDTGRVGGRSKRSRRRRGDGPTGDQRRRDPGESSGFVGQLNRDPHAHQVRFDELRGELGNRETSPRLQTGTVMASRRWACTGRRRVRGSSSRRGIRKQRHLLPSTSEEAPRSESNNTQGAPARLPQTEICRIERHRRVDSYKFWGRCRRRSRTRSTRLVPSGNPTARANASDSVFGSTRIVAIAKPAKRSPLTK